MKSNFDFLNRYWPALAQIGATAETYVYSDPNACIYKLGMFAERLVQEILVFEHIAEPAVDNTHANRIRILKRAGLLPHEIDNTLYVLRKTRNSAVHIGTDSVDEAKTLLSLTYNLAVWFMETYGDWGYIAPEFVMPSETTREDLESVIAEQERKIEELTKQLAVVKTAASGKTQKERARRSESVSAMMNWNEAQTRCLIDEQLRLSGWEADTQNLRYSKGTRPVKGRNIAISEWPTNSAFYKNGYADYAFFVGEKLVALMDAKKMSEDVASTIDVQVKDYAAHIKPEDIPHTVGNWNGYQVPFLFASNGRAYLEQLRTKSGIWFLDVREQENQPYPIRNWFSPSDLMEKLGQNTAAANQALAAADNSFMTDPNGLNLRDYQIKAIDKATEAIVDGKRTALLAMATGTGKTRTVLGLIYNMLESKRFRRILFLVDRVSLGEQAMDTFKDVKLKELLTLDKIYEIKAIDDNIINLETKVSISTVQGLLKRTILAEEPDLMPGAFDLIIVDEAHRGYILDREMTEEEKTVANDEMVRDVQTKIMHDNAFDEFASYLSENGLLGGANIGNFISVEDEFYIFDIAFFQNMFAEGGFVSELKEIQKVSIQKEAEQQVQGLNRGQQRNKTLQKQVRDIVEAATSKNEEEYKSAEALINMLASIIPYPQILCISNYLVVLNEKYLRDNISTAAFKYGGKVKVVGYITNKVMAQSNTHTSAFAEIGASINALMKIFFENADEMFVVHPVAIYYDN